MKSSRHATLTVFLIAATSAFAQTAGSASEGAAYDREGRLTAYQYLDGTHELYTYDRQGRMATFTDRAGNLTRFGGGSGGADSTSTSTTASAPIDGTLFTTYTPSTTQTSVIWFVCGSTQNTGGCYGSGNLGPFGKVGALIEGNPTTDTSTNTVTRLIYVLDVASGSNHNAVKLYIYKKTDMINPDFDDVTVALTKSANLPLVGGTSALASMAGDQRFLYIGTDQSSNVIQLQKSPLAATSTAGAGNVSAITANQYGYVTVSFGSFKTTSGNSAVFSPSGVIVQSGGGATFTLNTIQAALPSTFP